MFQLKTNIRIEKRWREKMHERKKTKCQNFRHCISADIFEAAKHFMHRHTYATHHTKQWHYVLLAIDRKFSYLAKVIVELCVVIFANTETTFYSGLHLCKIMYKSYLHRKPSGTNASEQWFLWSLSTSLLLYPSLSLCFARRLRASHLRFIVYTIRIGCSMYVCVWVSDNTRIYICLINVCEVNPSLPILN